MLNIWWMKERKIEPYTKEGKKEEMKEKEKI